MSTQRLPTLYLAAALMVALLAATWTLTSHPASASAPSREHRAAEMTLTAIKDTWINEAQPTGNYCGQSPLHVGRWQTPPSDIGERRILVEFDLSSIPRGSTINSARLVMYQVGAEGPESYRTRPDAIFAPWEECKVTWDTQPAAFSLGDPYVSLDMTNGDKAWDVTKIVQNWWFGEIGNYGILVRRDGDTEGLRLFGTREDSRIPPPRLVIDFDPPPDFTPSPTKEGEATPTATPTHTPTRTPTQAPTHTPTRTPTRTATPVPSTDLIAQQLEVTQGNQDLLNTTTLVRDKRTYVRFHVRSTSGIHRTFAMLRAQRGSSVIWLFPKNPGLHIWVRPNPDRGTLNHSFLFELPDGWREGNVTLTAYLNPTIPLLRPNRDPLETSYANNTTTTSVSFEASKRLNLVVYRIGYYEEGFSNVWWPPASDVTQMVDWMERAYPTHDVRYWMRNTFWLKLPFGGTPNCGQVNNYLWGKWAWDLIFNWGIPIGTHYYGMVDDRGEFMRGCAPVPGFVASGPTGTGSWGWDFDGSYGDWYGGHELAHAYNRGHANFCGAVGGPAYPYPSGRISPVLTGNSAIYGFDVRNWNIYGPGWRDVMTYCANQWIGPFTYEGLLDHFQSSPVLASHEKRAGEASRILVTGILTPSASMAELDPLFVIPNAGDISPAEPGDYDIVLRNEDGAQLARYPFTPKRLDGGPMQGGMEPIERRSIAVFAINELLPYVEGTSRVEIEGPDGKILTSVEAGTSAPEVTVTSPNGGEFLDEEIITVSWEASDPDGDPLTFNVQYSPDNGERWEMVAQDVTSTSIEIDNLNIVSGDLGLFRVWASDGIHTSSDTSDAPFTVPNHEPEVEILSPATGTTVVISETVTLEGYAYDADTGEPEASSMVWRSDIDGLLGFGETVSTASLSEGTHVITFEVEDGAGGSVTRSITLIVVSLEDAPGTPDQLVASPLQVSFYPETGETTATILIENLNMDNAVSWSATTSEPWVTLSATSGATPDEIVVTFNDPGLEPGIHTASITITSPDLPGGSVTVPVNVTIPAATFNLMLPVITR